MSKQVKVRDILIGGSAPVSIQSMTNVNPHDCKALLKQVNELQNAGCEIVRMSIPDETSASSFSYVRERTDLPLVADIHFNYKLAVLAVEAGADKIRINPGNIGDEDKVYRVVEACKKRNVPIRIGVNSGSLEKDILEKYGKVTAEGLYESAVRNVNIIEKMGFNDIVVSVKSSDVLMNLKAYKLIHRNLDYPLHVGVTEAGTPESGKIKSAVGIGSLLLQGIGDTIRVSLTGNPVEEVYTAKKILSACGLRKEAVEIISCPTCGRTRVNLTEIASAVENKLIPIGDHRRKTGKKNLKVAVMGCEVNGPGEARGADFGVACGDGRGLIFVKGNPYKNVAEIEIIKTLKWLAENYENVVSGM